MSWTIKTFQSLGLKAEHESDSPGVIKVYFKKEWYYVHLPTYRILPTAPAINKGSGEPPVYDWRGVHALRKLVTRGTSDVLPKWIRNEKGEAVGLKHF